MTELNGRTAIPKNAPIKIIKGATLNNNLSADEGMVSSLIKSLIASAIVCSTP